MIRDGARTVSLLSHGDAHTFDAEFFRTRVTVEPNGCWLWTGTLAVNGTRARFNWKRGGEYAYRIAYEVFYGPIPTGLMICHHCDDGRCVNPEHLYAGTAKDNSRDCHTRRRAVMPPTTRGENHPGAHPNDLFEAVRREYAKGELIKSEVAALFDISVHTVDKWTKGERVNTEPVRVRDGRFTPSGQGCGTRAGYFAHRGRSEDQCPDCLEANRVYMREYKNRRRATTT